MGYYDSPDLNPQGEGQDLVVPTGKDSWQRHSRSTRKRKGKVETYTYGGRAHLLKAIEQKGEAIPGDLARELGWSRSTLAHNLAKLQAKGKIVRMGGGRSTRYRVVTPDEALPGTPPPQAPDPGEVPQGKGVADGERPKGVESTAGLKGFFKKLLKG